MVIKNKILKRLSEIGKNQTWLAKRTEELFPGMGIPNDRLSRICSGNNSNPTIQTCLVIAKSLGDAVEDIFFLKK